LTWQKEVLAQLPERLPHIYSIYYAPIWNAILCFMWPVNCSL